MPFKEHLSTKYSIIATLARGVKDIFTFTADARAAIWPQITHGVMIIQQSKFILISLVFNFFNSRGDRILVAQLIISKQF
jgi:hypothetical protein